VCLNVDIVLGIYISTPVTSYIAKRSFSSLITTTKIYTPSKLEQEKLNALAHFSIESKMTHEIQFEDII